MLEQFFGKHCVEKKLERKGLFQTTAICLSDSDWSVPQIRHAQNHPRKYEDMRWYDQTIQDNGSKMIKSSMAISEGPTTKMFGRFLLG